MAIRSASAIRSYMMSALSNICILERILVVISSDGSVWDGVLSIVRRLVRYV